MTDSADQDDDACATQDGSDRPLVNCLMLVTWPARREMIQSAIASFVHQDYEARTLTVVNDGEPCELTVAFLKSCRGRVVPAPKGASIGEKRNLGVAAEPVAEYVASFDDDDFCVPTRVRAQVARLRAADAVWLSATRKFIAIRTLENMVGFEHGRCYGAGMIRAEVARVARLATVLPPQRSMQCTARKPSLDCLGAAKAHRILTPSGRDGRNVDVEI